MKYTVVRKISFAIFAVLMQQIIDFLAGFIQVSAEEVDDLVAILNFSSHPKNDILLKQGSISNRIAFLLKGGIRAYYKDENNVEHTIAFSFENTPLAEFDNFSRQAPSSIEVITLEPVELIWIGHQDFFNFLEKYPKYEGALRAILSHYIQIDSEQWRLLRINNASERYKALCKTRPDIIQRVPAKHIASYLEMAVETLSRIRAEK